MTPRQSYPCACQTTILKNSEPRSRIYGEATAHLAFVAFLDISRFCRSVAFLRTRPYTFFFLAEEAVRMNSENGVDSPESDVFALENRDMDLF